MGARTQLFSLLPWSGGLNTSLDESTIPVNQLTVADNIIFSTRGSRKKREGINHDYDDQSAGTDSIIGLHDFWYGTSTRTQKLVAVNSARALYSYSSGTRATLTDGGTAWSATTVTNASMETFNNQCFIATDIAAHCVKRWDGTNNVLDLFSDYNNVSISRASSGTTRTLIFTAGFGGTNGSTVVVSGASVASYNGTFTVTGVTTTSVTNDTITYTSTSLTEGTTADTGIKVGAVAPKASLVRKHIGRLILNDKANPDRLHYSPAFDHTKWNGIGDSGAFDIGVGDGDPDGITAIFPTFKGDLFIAKRTKLYRLSGNSPEDIQITKVSDSIGCISHNSVVQVGNDDIMWVSEKGVHSLQAVNAYGDFTSADVSIDIQKTFNDDLTRSRLKYCWGAYLPQINSVAWAFTEASGLNRVLTTSTVNNAIYLFNIPLKSWYRWSDIPCSSLIVANDSDKKRFYFGTHTNRVSKSFSGLTYDQVGNSGTHTAITMRVVTGQMFPPGLDPTTLVGYKEFILYFRPQANTSVNVSVKIDKQRIPNTNQLVYQEASGGTPLGTGFTLGSTPLGTSAVMSGYGRLIDGIGHSAKVTIEESSLTGQLEVQGIGLRIEPLTYISEVAS